MRSNRRQLSILAALWMTLLSGSAFAGAPTAGNVAATVVEGGWVYIRLAASDAETIQPDLEHIITQNPANGAVTYRYPSDYPRYSRDVVYTSSGGPGTDTFKYKVKDEEGLESGEATVTLTVNANTPPTANNVAVRLAEGSVDVLIYLSGADSQPGYMPLVYIVAQGPAHGTVTDQSTPNQKRYTPNAGFVGTDSFTYKVRDPQGLESGEATVTLTVEVNTPPTAGNCAYALPQASVDYWISMSGADAHTSYTALEYIVIQGPAHGTLTDYLSPTYYYKLYTPNPSFFGTDSFTYKVRDPQGLESGEATVTLTVEANVAPVAGTVRAVCAPDASITKRFQYYDPDAMQTITVSLVSGAANGTVTISGNNFVYMPDTGFQGVDSFTYKINDGVVDSNVATVRIQVRAANNRAGNLILVLARDTLYTELGAEVDGLRADLIAEGYSSVVQTVSWGSGQDLWNRIKAEYERTDQWLEGVILVGELPRVQSVFGSDNDLILWNMAFFGNNDMNVSAGDFCIWVSRLAGVDLTYGNEIALMRRALDANHNYRAGISRLPHAAYWWLNPELWYDGQLDRLLEVWPEGAEQCPPGGVGCFLPERGIGKGGVDALVAGGEVWEQQSHGDTGSYMNGIAGVADVFTLINQTRYNTCASCSSGAYGGIVNQHLFTRGGGHILSVGGSVINYMGDFTISDSNSEDVNFRTLLAQGASFGSSALRSSSAEPSPVSAGFVFGTRSAKGLNRVMIYGDLSLGAMASPANAMPDIVGFTQTPAGEVCVGQPVTFSVAVTDPDGAGEKSPHVAYRHQVEWFMNGYNYGMNNPTYTTDDTQGSGWTNQTHTFASPGTYSIRAEVMDEWHARSWREMTVIVNTPPVASNDTATVDAVNDVTIPVLANDVELDGEALTLDAITTPPGHGTAVIVGATVVYTATNLFWAGVDTFVYRVRDTAGLTATATATVTVTVSSDISPPHVFSVSSAGDPTVVTVVFDERVLSGGGANGAENTANYVIDHGVAVSAAVLQADGKTVKLTVSTLSEGIAYTLTVDHIADLKNHPMATPQAACCEYFAVVPGVRYAYHEGSWSLLPDFDALTPVKEGTNTVFDISARLRDDNFAFRFTGVIRIDTSGEYTFYTTSDDGSKLYIAPLAGLGQVVSPLVNNDGLHGAQEQSGTVTLDAGYHNLVVTMFEQGSGQELSVSWQGPSIAKQTIPADVLFHYPVIVNADSDSDGIPNSVDPDDDNDGMSDADEAAAGTDPTNRLSVLCVSASEFRAPSSEFVIRWQSASNKYYTVQAATNLLSGFTLNLRTSIRATPPENVHTDNVTGVGCRFYRVKVE